MDSPREVQGIERVSWGVGDICSTRRKPALPHSWACLPVPWSFWSKHGDLWPKTNCSRIACMFLIKPQQLWKENASSENESANVQRVRRTVFSCIRPRQSKGMRNYDGKLSPTKSYPQRNDNSIISVSRVQNHLCYWLPQMEYRLIIKHL